MDETVLGSLRVPILSGTLEDTSTGRRLKIGTQRSTIGRAKGCDLQIDDRGVSAVHLEVFATERGVLLRDAGSKNGTWIDGIRIGEVHLTGPATIRIGNAVLAFHERAAKEQELPASFGPLKSRSPRMRAVFGQLHAVSRTSLNVFLTGESGSGKTYIAQVIHDLSPRAKKPFGKMDVCQYNDQLIEAALFGHVKGAFTGAHTTRVSPIVEANGGTFFLDEIGDLSESAQKAFLRLLDEKVLQPVGGSRAIKVDVRFISGSLHDLQARVNQRKGFRDDLFFRLGVRIEIPPLRERLEDFEFIVERILADAGRSDLFAQISPRTFDRLRERVWPGGIRSIRDVLHFALQTFEMTSTMDLETAYTTVIESARSDRLSRREQAGGVDEATRSDHPVSQLITDGAELEKVEEAARRLLLAHLYKECDGVVSEIARRAGISLPYARRELARLDLRPIEPPPRWMKRRKGPRQ